jgi:hypothetical protein
MKRILVALTAVCVGAMPARAHPIHTTLTVVTVDATHHTVTLSIRAFADDFSAVVARAAGRAAPADSSVSQDDIARYVRARFTIAGATLEPCGVQRTSDAYVMCFRATLRTDVGATVIRNAILTELHTDQVNIVQVQSGSARTTHLFTKESSAKPLRR